MPVLTRQVVFSPARESICIKWERYDFLCILIQGLALQDRNNIYICLCVATVSKWSTTITCGFVVVVGRGHSHEKV